MRALTRLGLRRTLLRRGLLVAAVGVLAPVGLLPATGSAAAPRHASRSSDTCPAAESLVPNTTWRLRTLAPGITMSTGTATDSRGKVNMHVMRVDLTRRSISFTPLMHSLAERSPLSALAAGHKHLVAATNTGYFDFRTGAPTGPVLSHGSPAVISVTHKAVVGFGPNRLAEAGHLWWAAQVTDGTEHHGLGARNVLDRHSGLTQFTSQWGSTPVPVPWGGTVRAVVGGVISDVQREHWGVSVPQGGYLLVANDRTTSSWLSALRTGSTVSISSTVETDVAKPFTQAYGVGVQLVKKAGVVQSGFSCRSANTTQPARTAIGFSDGGRKLVIAIVADHPFTSEHGLDEDQMSKLMVQLGVSRAYAFDGSGSTELLARLPRASALTLQNYPADGAERPMPLGLGIASTARRG
jgi:hypothetical protein